MSVMDWLSLIFVIVVCIPIISCHVFCIALAVWDLLRGRMHLYCPPDNDQ